MGKKKKIAVILAGALAVGGVVAGALAQKAPGDDVVITQVLKNKTAEDLVGTASSVGSNETTLTPEQVEAIIEELKNPEANGGLLEIAQDNRASMGQVKAVKRAVDQKLRELAGHEEPGEVHP